MEEVMGPPNARPEVFWDTPAVQNTALKRRVWDINDDSLPMGSPGSPLLSDFCIDMHWNSDTQLIGSKKRGLQFVSNKRDFS